MQTVSERFLASLRDSHAVATSCELVFPGSVVRHATGLEAGTVRADRGALIRRTAGATIPWSAGAELEFDLASLPLGGYAILRRGIAYPDGTRELVQLGTFRVESVSRRQLADTASLELADRMAQVRDEPFVVPYSPVDEGAEIVLTGTLTHGSATVTGLSSTASLLVGMLVAGPGIPAGTTIASIDSGSQVTLSLPAVRVVEKVARTDESTTRLWEIDNTATIVVGAQVDLGNNDNGYPNLQQPANTYVATIVSSSEVHMTQVTDDGDTGQIHTPGLPSSYVLARFTIAASQSLTFGGGKRIAAAAVDLVFAVFGSSIAYHVPHDPPVFLSDVFYTENRAEAVDELGVAAGGEAYFDVDGAFVFGPLPNPAAAPVWTIDAGAAGVLVDADETFDRTDVYNGVLVSGQNAATDAPVSALVVDDDPSSPTYWTGPFGKVARVVSSTAVQTDEQALELAGALLADELGLTRALVIVCVPNPALEPGDVVRVRFPDGRDELHVLDTVETPLDPAGAQKLTTRAVYVPTWSLPLEVPIGAVALTTRALVGLPARRELTAARRVSAGARARARRREVEVVVS